MQNLKLIALKAREDFEDCKINLWVLKQLYQQYNKLDNIDTFVQHAKEMFPRLNCGLAAVWLRKQIKNSRIVNGKYAGNNHTFLLAPKLIIVDITADQYNGPKVYVGRIRMPWSMN